MIDQQLHDALATAQLQAERFLKSGNIVGAAHLQAAVLAIGNAVKEGRGIEGYQGLISDAMEMAQEASKHNQPTGQSLAGLTDK